MRYEFGGLIFGGAYTWRGLFSEFYGKSLGFVRGNLYTLFLKTQSVQLMYVYT